MQMEKMTASTPQRKRKVPLFKVIKATSEERGTKPMKGKNEMSKKNNNKGITIGRCEDGRPMSAFPRQTYGRNI